MGITRAFGKQYRKPTGIFGSIIARQMNRHHITLTEWAIESLEPQPESKILDIGCGGGMAIGKLAEVVTDGEIVGIDYSEHMVEAARSYNASAIAAGKVTVQQEEVSKLPFQDAWFDGAWAIESFYYWPDYISDLVEIKRVLKPGGRLVILLEWSKNNTNIRSIAKLAKKMECPLHSGDEIVELLLAAGYVQARQDFRPDGNWLLVLGEKPA